MTATRHYHASDGTFRKVLPADQARRELAGRRAIAKLLPVPPLLDVRHVEDGCEIVYEDVFASGRCTGLLADCINTADRDLGRLPMVRALVNQVCDGLLVGTGATGTISRLDTCVPDLHVARLAPADGWTAGTPTHRSRPGCSVASGSAWPILPAGHWQPVGVSLALHGR